MRGKACIRLYSGEMLGITPAYAGKSCRCCRCSSCVWDHPRLCGEKAASVSPSSTSVGSPPPMRGKGEYTEEATKQSGITPAYAGKRNMNVTPYSLPWDHPRLCGEKPQNRQIFSPSLGSPPPMRGKVRNAVYGVFVFRITPAYAGKRRNREN